MQLWTFALAIAVPLCTVSQSAAASDCTCYLIIRYDDYSPIPLYERSNPAPDIERRLFALVEAHDAKISVGVVPFADEPAGLSPADCEPEQSWLSDEQNEWVVLLRDYVRRDVVEPALHGFTHRRNTLPGHRPGEFRGQPPAWQEEAVRDGQCALSAALNRPVQVFIPPWNAWDEHTASALAGNGFDWLSPDLHRAGASPLPVRALPQTTANPGIVLNWIRSRELPSGSMVVLVTHPFDFEGQGTQEYWTNLESLLEEVQQSDCWTAAAFADLPAGTSAEWNARFREVVAINGAHRLLEDSIGGSLLVDSQIPAMVSAHGSRAVNLPIVAGLWLGLPALLGMGIGLLGRRLIGGNPVFLLSTILLAAIMLTWLVTGAVNITQQGYAIRGIRWQAIFLVGGCVAAFMAELANSPRRKDHKAVRARNNAAIPKTNLTYHVRYEH